jgi:DNA primase
MARYSEELVAQLKAHADIATIVQRFIPLRQQGKSWLGICPFHDDRKPSMHVTPSMGIYKCFACGAGGDVFKFVMEHEKIDFNSAVEMVAQESGFALPSQTAGNKAEMEDRAVVLALNDIAAEWFAEQYKQSRVAQDYVARRGLTPETCARFGIGYAPDQWEGLVGRAASRGFSPKQMVLGGLANEKETGGTIDKFRGRLMIAIHNISGRIVGFGGRIMVDGTNAPKYMNSPETPLYHKSDILFGLNHARQAIEKAGEVIVVEGYFDLISLYQAGIQNVVAVSGTAFTDQHARLLARYAKKVFLVFDGDNAGRKAARKSLEILLPVGIQIRVLVLPEEDDPDELVREKGAQAFRDLLANRSKDFLDHLHSELPMGTPEERTAFLNEVRRLIGTIQDPFLREEYLNLATQRFPVSRRLMTAPLPAPKPPKVKSYQEPDPMYVEPEPIPTLPPIESRLLLLLLRNPSLWKPMHAWFDPDIFESRTTVEIVDHSLAIFEEKGDFDLAELTTRIPENLRDLILQLKDEIWSADAAQKDFLATLVQITVSRLIRARQNLQGRSPQSDQGIAAVTNLRLECNRFIRQLETVKTKLTSEGGLQSASLLWHGLREQLPAFFSKLHAIVD